MIASIEYPDSRLAARGCRRHLEPRPQVQDRQHALLIVDHAADPRGHVRPRRRLLPSQDALDAVNVGGEQITAEPKGHDLRLHLCTHVFSGTRSAVHAVTRISASTTANSWPPRVDTPSTTPSAAAGAMSPSRSNAITPSASSIANAPRRPTAEARATIAARAAPPTTPSAGPGV